MLLTQTMTGRTNRSNVLVRVTAVLIAILASSFTDASTLPSAGPLTVSLKASWPAPPLLEEMLETVSIVAGKLKYFQAVEALIGLDAFESDQVTYRSALMRLHDADVLTGATLALFQTNMALHTAAPVIEAFYQFYRASVEPSDVSDGCADSFVVWHMRRYCDVNQFASKAVKDLEFHAIKQLILEFDHVLGNQVPESHIAVLYGSISSDLFQKFHTKLSMLVRSHSIVYIHRWKPSSVIKKESLWLGGFGVELAIKSTEYKVVDDQKVSSHTSYTDKSDLELETQGLNGTELVLRYPERSIQLEEYRDVINAMSVSSNPFKVPSQGDLKRLPFKFASFIAASPIPLQMMSTVLQDFPKYANFISQQDISYEVTRQIAHSQARLYEAGENAVYINGIPVAAEKLDAYSVLKTIQLECESINALTDYGFTIAQSRTVLQQSSPVNRQSQTNQANFDVFDIREVWEIEGRKKKPHDEASAVIWWNDLSKDKKYASWSRSIYDLLQAQGGLPRVRKNLFSALFMVDLNSHTGLAAAADSLKLIKSMVAVRFGIVAVHFADNTNSEKLARLFYSLLAHHGRKVAGEFIEQLNSYGKVDMESAIKWHSETVAQLNSQTPSDSKNSDEVSKKVKEATVDQMITSSRFMAKQFDLGFGASKNGGMLVNGRYFNLDDVSFIHRRFFNRQNYQLNFNNVLSQTMQQLQQLLYYGQLHESTNLQQLYLRSGTLKKSRNYFLTVSSDNPLVFHDLRRLVKIDDLKLVRYARNCSEACLLTVWIIGNVSEHLMQEATKFMDNDLTAASVRLAMISQMNNDEYSNNANSKLTELITDGTQIVVNGRRIGPLPLSYHFTADDFAQLVNIELERAQGISDAIKHADMQSTADLITLITTHAYNLIAQHIATRGVVQTGITAAYFSRTSILPNPEHTLNYFIEGDESTAPVHIDAVLNPLSEFAQKVIVILQKLTDMDFAHGSSLYSIRVHLNPANGELTELPIKRFYRFSLPAMPKFTAAGKLKPLQQQFKNLPVEPLLTLGIDSPQAWVVTPKVSVHDLDNIRLMDMNEDTMRSGVVAEFQLRYLLVEGHVQDLALQMAPRGLQFNLGTPTRPDKMDTIVMANLGYFQLKANPGVWDLQIRPGRCREFYDIEGIADGAKAIEGKSSIPVHQFQGALVYVNVRKNHSKLNEDLLAEIGDASSPSVFESWMPWIAKQPTINIFSVASGHLYERFLRIMILSVLRHTKSPVKFWFIENFLSPSFKDFIPHMAKSYNFEVELITYKWPQWLRAQTEKQRIIWGYKILFLDVLFPLNLSRVIFVDADQIVRADLGELIKMDLKGAPYGYTPFCKSRQDIEGFRFWKHGYWKSHLAGKPYHISALYVIDLVKFRQMAAGDRLRQQYHSLSADPSSLANLDQDLPNDMQHQVPIFSLPQEWLWCETWCDDGSLKTAKTIDLCNNPMTKEPKLDRARRLLPEWNEYDVESRKLYDSWKSSREDDKMLLHDEL